MNLNYKFNKKGTITIPMRYFCNTTTTSDVINIRSNDDFSLSEVTAYSSIQKC